MLSKHPEDIRDSIVPEFTVFKFILEQKSLISANKPSFSLTSVICFAAFSPTPLIAHRP